MLRQRGNLGVDGRLVAEHALLADLSRVALDGLEDQGAGHAADVLDLLGV